MPSYRFNTSAVTSDSALTSDRVGYVEGSPA